MPTPSEDLQIVTATSAAEIAAARHLVKEYGESLGVDLSFQNFQIELELLPGEYALPKGALLLARIGDNYAGCVALRPWASTVCEMKRLYVRPRWRGRGIGQRLIDEILNVARRAGYSAMRLDTLPSMSAARALYESFGFRPIAPYYDSPVHGTTFMEFDLIRKATKAL